jgi:hypothetical protein
MCGASCRTPAQRNRKWEGAMHRMLSSIAVLALVVSACAELPTQPTTFELPVFSHGAGNAALAGGANFGAPLNAEEEVMPAGIINDSRARGNSIFKLSRDGTTMTFQLIVANIENVTMAHIHLGAFGTNGPPIVWLHPGVDARAPLAGGGGRIQGVIAADVFTAADFVGPLVGASMADLVALLRAGNAYVNVHTNDGADPTNTGPGDFPSGEIRGQIRHRGH